MSTGFNVKINNLIKVFNNNKVVLNNISLNVHSGESIVILGESGVGKSVFMRIVGMLLNPTSGSIKIHNQETIGISNVDRNKLMEKVGFLFQYSGLFEHLTNWENVAFRKLFILKQNRKKCKEEAIEMLTRLGIKETAFELKPNEISGGMQRRVAMARTLMKEPNLILLDEPTSGLDPVMSNIINDVILKTRDVTKATMITITHDLHSALRISDKIYVIRNGNFIWSGEKDKIFDSDDEYIKLFIKSSGMSFKV